MKQTLISLLLVIFSCSILQAQREIARNTLNYPNNSFFTSDSWADEEGYLLVRFKFSSDLNAFRFLHRERGELSSFADNINMSDILGYTSTELEFTLYFKGFALNKRGYYFITFFKNNNRAPLLNTWMDKVVQGDYLFSYSAFGKLYILREEDKKLLLVEVTDYGKSKMIPIQSTKEQLKNFKFDHPRFGTSYANAKAIGSEQTILCYKDSCIVVGEGKSTETFKRFTRLTKLDYATGKLDERRVQSPETGNIVSKILEDRFYQLRFSVPPSMGTGTIGLRVYEYPSLKLLHTFKYGDGENITIKTSPLIREKATDTDKYTLDLGKYEGEKDKWIDEKRDRKVMNEVLKGKPQLSVQHDSARTRMLIGSLIEKPGTYVANGAGGFGPSGGTATPASMYVVAFDACFSNGVPCQNVQSKTPFYLAVEAFNNLKAAKKG